MRSSAKIGMLILVVLIASLAVGIGLFLNFIQSTYDELESTGQLAKNLTKEQCLDRMAERLRACDGGLCLMSTGIFSGECLTQAQGSYEEFCLDKPALQSSELRDKWARNYCAKEQLDEIGCEFSFITMVEYCGDGSFSE